MLESTLPRIVSWMSLIGGQWRLSTWWPSDSRDSMQRSLLRLLSVAHRERLDVAPLVANFAEEHRGGYRRRLRRLARRLADGTPLVDTLEQTPDVLRDESVLALRFATQTGTLAQTYRQLIDSDDAGANRIDASLRQTVFYALVMLVLTVLSLSFLFVFIFPTLDNINEELAPHDPGQTPWAYRTLVTLCLAVANYAPLWILGVIIVAWLTASSPARRYFRRFVGTRWLRSVAERRSAEMLRMLSLAVEQGRPIPAAISTLARYHFDPGIRQKLMLARLEAEHRSDIWNIFSEVRLLSPEESLALAGASSDRSRVWTMRRLADWKLDCVSRRNEMLVAWVGPIVVLLFAAIVLLAGSSMFGFLSQLIQEWAW